MKVPDIHEAAWAYLECASWSTYVSDGEGNIVAESLDDTDAQWNTTAIAAATSQIEQFLDDEEPQRTRCPVTLHPAWQTAIALAGM